MNTPLHDDTHRRCRVGLAPLLLAVLAASLPTTAAGQNPFANADPEFVDRVIAVVGDSIVTVSQVTERMFQLGPENLPTDSAAIEELREEVLDALINEQLLLQAAIKDTLIAVDDVRIDEIVDQELESRIQGMGGQTALQRALSQQGWTLPSYREFLKGEARRQNLQQQYLARQGATRRPPIVEEVEMRAFFDEQQEALPERPATIEFANIVVEVEASDSAKQVALALADTLLDQVLAGEDFEALAEQYSDDPGSRQTGGDLGWFRRGSGFVKEFEDAAFQLLPGQVSVPIETQFGYHLILVERVRGPERKARHILIQPEIIPADVDRARDLAADVRQQLDAGGDFGALQDEHGTGPIPDTTTIAANQLAQLPPGYAAALQNVQSGSVVGPIEFSSGPRTDFGLALVIEVREAGRATYEDVQGEIQQVLSQQKIQEEILDELRSRTHVEIRSGQGQ